MILDLHNHSIRSDDGRAKVENYCQWIRRRGIPIDGFVLTEHRQWDAESDYRGLEDEHGLLILKGSEVETDYGHVLVFGVNDELVHAFDFARIDLPLALVLEEAARCGAFAVPCHPGRPKVGMRAHIEAHGEVAGVEVIETLNGGSRGRENDDLDRAGRGRTAGAEWAAATPTSSATWVAAPRASRRAIRDEQELVRELRVGRYEAIRCH